MKPVKPMEMRTVKLPVEIRTAGGSRMIGGYAAVFGLDSHPLGGFVEQVAPTCFNKSAADGWPGVVCRFNHDDNQLLGTSRSGTLELAIDRQGVRYDVDVPQCRQDVLELVGRGDVAHSSFAFQTYEDDWTTTQGGVPLRTLVSARLIDVAPVTNPAYPDATVGLRSLARHVDAPLEDVVARSHAGELRQFFVRTGEPLTGVTAKAITTTKKPPPIPGSLARVKLMERRYAGGKPQ
jgi:HK97 family phage prohead protease